MTAPIVTLINNKGGVGKTSLVYHLAWMLADLGHRVVAADLDPQANLTSAFLDEREIEDLWDSDGRSTVWGSIRPFHEGESALTPARPRRTGDDRLVLVAGDLGLSAFEDDLSGAWPECLDGKARAFRVMSAFWWVLNDAATAHGADIVLVDVGPSLGAINRAALVASDHVIFPVAPDLFSLQGLRNLGPTLAGWRAGWQERLKRRPSRLEVLPGGAMEVLGYVVMGHAVRLDRPVKAYQRWLNEIPGEFRTSVLQQSEDPVPPPENDPYCLAQLKHYRSLMPLAQEARKPMFALKPADGAFGGHYQAAQGAYADFRALTTTLLNRLALSRSS